MALIGIDLGTTNSLIGYVAADGPKLVRNPLQSTLTPSVVAVDDDGQVVVGAAAREMAATRPDRAVAAFKRFMGTDRDTRLGGKVFRPEELSALVLKSLVADFVAETGETVDEAIISCPAYFNDAQRKATLNAARLAGIKVERLVNEPTAAVLAYGLQTAEEGSFLVFDLGGGTFDISILQKYDGVFEVRASAGDNYLGGEDFTAILAERIAKAAGVGHTLSVIDKARLERVAEEAKCRLSSQHSIDGELRLEAATLAFSLDRAEFEEAAQPLLRRLRAPLERAIQDAGIAPSALDAIVLVGGATRMPMVRNLVARMFGKIPHGTVNPDEVVAIGATLQAGLKARHAAVDDVILTDVCPYTLGITARRERPDGRHELVMAPIIERNATVPISRVERFSSVADNQAVVRVEICQGESFRPADNVQLGAIEVDIPKNKAGEESIDVRFTYDINGALEAEVTVVTTGQRKIARFANTSGLSDEELAAHFRKLADIKMLPRDMQANRELLARADRLHAEALGSAREMMADAILTFSAEIENQQARNLDQVRSEFRAFLDRFEGSGPFGEGG